MSKFIKGLIWPLLFFIALAVYSFYPRDNNIKEIAGAETQTDPNHPQEIYYGSPQIKDLQTMITDLAINIYPQDKINALPDPTLGIGSQITLTRATPVEVTDAKVVKIYRTWKNNIKDLLAENNIELIAQDSVEPPTETAISYNMKVKITRVAEFDATEREAIDFKTIKKNDVDLEKGQTKTEQKGIKGEKDVIYHIKRVDGEEVSRKIIDTKVLSEPTTEILIIGIGPKLVHSGLFIEWLNAAAKETLVNATALQCLMMRESGGTPEAGWPDAYYKGLFQYEEGYWADASARHGYGGVSIYDAKAQIFTTAHEIARGQSRRWPPFAKCSNL